MELPVFDGGDSNVRKFNTVNRRVFILKIAKGIIFTGIVARLFSLQITENKKYLTLSDKNRLREWRLPPVRGEFEDYFGNVVAGNTKVYQLHVVPEQVEDFKYLMVRLKNILSLSDKQFSKIVKKKKQQKPWETLIISESLTWDQFSKVNFYLHELSGAKPVLSVARSYPYKANYTHVLGYVAQASESDLLENEEIKNKHVPGLRVGKTGLEKTFENSLIGTNSVKRYEVNAFGKRINQVDFKEGEKGQKVKLTIDTEIQKLCNELLAEKSGSISVMDIFTGEIIAMHSSPSFDPNLFMYGISYKDWDLIRKNPLKPLINKTISGLYSPGSTIKPIVALSALENDVISTKFKVNCTGKMEMYGQTYHCWKKKGHGIVDLRDAIKQSCDTYFYEMSRRLGVDRLNITAKRFGLGNTVFKNLYIEEKKGLVPSTKWKKNALGKGWVLGETLITGIGQGYIQTTPLQLCLMTAQLANGGFKIFPRITVDKNQESLEKIKYKMEARLKITNENSSSLIRSAEEIFTKGEKEYNKLFRNQENIKFVLEAMSASTNEVRGTSYRSRIDDPKYRFAGKTGTAQVKKITKLQRELDLDTAQIPYEERDHAWYVAFGPYKDPRYALCVLVEHGGSGSATAAPLAKKLMKKIIDRHEEREKIRKNNLVDI
ncbi:penicillin-binding protein 2 [Candidatus Pelagibacter communis]|uniref:penicillin-binding protein 2 n=1 Tax=Pelagibacter ubique TaxID=198252 RepID=UPI00094DE563|nr:penicillin-binding protein 2 [Candidatus Pelagibacter ubique]